jgi:hypothetical protein
MTVTLFADPKTGETIHSFDGRCTMRSLRDALYKLREVGGLSKDADVLIQVVKLELPDGRAPGLVSVTPADPGPKGRWTVLMPSSSRFFASSTVGERRTFAIEDLHQGISDPDGNVRLWDGTFVHALELEPESLHYTLDKEYEEILCAVIRALKAEERCFRPLDERLPELIVLDYARVAELGRKRLPSLKAIYREVLKDIPDLTRHKLARVLAIAGLRRPRSGPRARAD